MRTSLFRPRFSFRCPPPRKIRIQALERFGAGHRTRMRRLAEVHHYRVGVSEGRPGRDPFAVGVAAFGEVHPVSGNGFRDLQVGFGRLRIVGIEMLENIGHIHAVR